MSQCTLGVAIKQGESDTVNQQQFMAGGVLGEIQKAAENTKK